MAESEVCSNRMINGKRVLLFYFEKTVSFFFFLSPSTTSSLLSSSNHKAPIRYKYEQLIVSICLFVHIISLYNLKHLQCDLRLQKIIVNKCQSSWVESRHVPSILYPLNNWNNLALDANLTTFFFFWQNSSRTFSLPTKLTILADNDKRSRCIISSVKINKQFEIKNEYVGYSVHKANACGRLKHIMKKKIKSKWFTWIALRREKSFAHLCRPYIIKMIVRKLSQYIDIGSQTLGIKIEIIYVKIGQTRTRQ